MKTQILDARRQLIIPGDAEQTLAYATADWVNKAKAAIADHGFFAVALSGGTTPKAIFQRLVKEYATALDWSRVWLFWSDERSVPPHSPESNFHMAMIEAGMTALPLSSENIHRMEAEKDIHNNSLNYEKLIQRTLKKYPFDLIMLGMGEDGHTASLFPHTKGLAITNRLVIANEVPQKGTWRMTFTFACINQAHHALLYVVGASKASILRTVLHSPPNFTTYPSQAIGTELHPATWILDTAAAQEL